MRINQLIIKCKENAHFPRVQTEVFSCFFCPNNSLKPKDSYLLTWIIKKKQQVLTFEKLKASLKTVFYWSTNHCSYISTQYCSYPPKVQTCQQSPNSNLVICCAPNSFSIFPVYLTMSLWYKSNEINVSRVLCGIRFVIPGNPAFVKMTLPDRSLIPALVLVVHSTQFVPENSQNRSKKTKDASLFHWTWCETFPCIHICWYPRNSPWFSQPNVGRYEWSWCTLTHFITLILVLLHCQVS